MPECVHSIIDISAPSNPCCIKDRKDMEIRIYLFALGKIVDGGISACFTNHPQFHPFDIKCCKGKTQQGITVLCCALLVLGT